jgi:hypothetical protein
MERGMLKENKIWYSLGAYLSFSISERSFQSPAVLKTTRSPRDSPSLKLCESRDFYSVLEIEPLETYLYVVKTIFIRGFSQCSLVKSATKPHGRLLCDLRLCLYI